MFSGDGADAAILLDTRLNLHRIVGDETVAALDELDGRLALADAAVAEQQHALAVDLHQHAVACDARRKLDVQIRNERRDNI